MTELVLGHGIWVINLVAEDNEWDFRELLHRQESVKLGFRFGKAFVILSINEENDTVDFWEVILPETAGYELKAISDEQEGGSTGK
jgi:hypothetical protein